MSPITKYWRIKPKCIKPYFFPRLIKEILKNTSHKSRHEYSFITTYITPLTNGVWNIISTNKTLESGYSEHLLLVHSF